jgi:hypothetical protein
MNAAFRTCSEPARHIGAHAGCTTVSTLYIDPASQIALRVFKTDEEIAMSKFLVAAAASAGLLALSGGVTLAADYDGEYVPSRHHYAYQHDNDSAAAEVREEQRELAQAHRRLRRAWWNGDEWEARRAAAKVREERQELWQARRKLESEQGEAYRGDYYDQHPRYHRWWD